MSQTFDPLLTEDSLPVVDLDTFADIVAGRPRCPTLMDLANVADGREPGLESGWDTPAVHQHLRCCPDCEENHRALQLVANAAERATELAVSGH